MDYAFGERDPFKLLLAGGSGILTGATSNTPIAVANAFGTTLAKGLRQIQVDAQDPNERTTWSDLKYLDTWTDLVSDIDPSSLRERETLIPAAQAALYAGITGGVIGRMKSSEYLSDRLSSLDLSSDKIEFVKDALEVALNVGGPRGLNWAVPRIVEWGIAAGKWGYDTANDIYDGLSEFAQEIADTTEDEIQKLRGR